jgi:hypothetical protein
MSNLNEKEFYQILEEVPELSHISPELEHELRSHLNDKIRVSRPAKKILEDIIDKNANGRGSQGKMNFYPSPPPSTSCMQLCIGIATKKFGHKRDEIKNRTGFKGLIIEIIEYWIGCGNTNNKTILFTTDWDNVVFNENWKGIVDKYKSQGKEVKIFEVCDDKIIVRYN